MTQTTTIQQSELILNPDGSVFHLHLKPGQIATTIILVGDPNRVDIISSFLSDIEFKVSNREYVSTTGKFNGKRITVVSTGVGIGNVDIVINELDALLNIDFDTRKKKSKITKIDFIRIGTSGSLQKEIKVNSYVISKYSVGLDNLLYFYDGVEKSTNKELKVALNSFLALDNQFINPYVINASEKLFKKLNSTQTYSGITITSPGFYGPQNRELRLNPAMNSLYNNLSDFDYSEEIVTNYEMESAAIYGLTKLLGHEAVTICLIIANRINGEVNKNYREKVKRLVLYVLEKI